jgi:predicted helicase
VGGQGLKEEFGYTLASPRRLQPQPLHQDFERVDHIDLHGNVRRNPKLSGTTHNVFGIQVGVGITLAVKKNGAVRGLRYHRVPELWRKREKLDFLAKGKVPWQTLKPDAKYTWLVPEHADEYRGFLPIEEMFDLHSVGVKTNRDDVVYSWDRDGLAKRMKRAIADYNAEVHRHKADPQADWPDHINRITSTGVATSSRTRFADISLSSMTRSSSERSTGPSQNAGYSSTGS